MRLYYQGPQVLVTDDAIEIWNPDHQRFELRELDDLRIIRYPLDVTVRSSMHAAAGAVVIVLLQLPALDTVEAWITALLLVAFPCAVSRTCLSLRPRTHELRASRRGREISLFVSADEVAFGQVRRAVVRALQAGRTDRHAV